MKEQILKNFELLKACAVYNGNYKISTTVNGKPSWKNGANAIWYLLDIDHYWIIGPTKYIGQCPSQHTPFFCARDDFSGLTADENHWFLRNGMDEWYGIQVTAVYVRGYGRFNTRHIIR